MFLTKIGAQLLVFLYPCKGRTALENIRDKAPVMDIADEVKFREAAEEAYEAVMGSYPVPLKAVREYERIAGKYAPEGLPRCFPYLDKWSVGFFHDMCILASRNTLAED